MFSMSRPTPLPINADQESVWSFPRPAVAQASKADIKVEFGGKCIASSRNTIRTLETSHPPSYYIPHADVDMDCLKRSGGKSSFCEWKGSAIYYDVVVGDKTAAGAAWSYPSPSPTFAGIKDCIAFYPAMMDACFVDDERVTPQPGTFYGGWITSKVVGPFKGEKGSMGW